MKNEKSIFTWPQSHTQWGSYAPYLKPIKLQQIMAKIRETARKQAYLRGNFI